MLLIGGLLGLEATIIITAVLASKMAYMTCIQIIKLVCQSDTPCTGLEWDNLVYTQANTA